MRNEKAIREYQKEMALFNKRHGLDMEKIWAGDPDETRKAKEGADFYHAEMMTIENAVARRLTVREMLWNLITLSMVRNQFKR